MHLSKNNNRDYGFEQSSLYCKKIVMQRIRKGRWNIVEEGFVSKPFMCAEMKNVRCQVPAVDLHRTKTPYATGS
jgi:hypothetical protein